jgi:NAD(P)-dependent dehydrogenase (short-subunit alcohol dehydrogenase family)/acyl carrier protein
MTCFPLTGMREAFRFMAQAHHVGKVVVTRPVTGEVLRIRADGAYLVTGGFGALGRRLGLWLAEQGAGTVALVGRRPPGSEAAGTLAAIEAAGATVLALQGDIAEAGAVQRVLDAIAAAGRPLRGIIHAAGVLDDGVLINQDWARFRQVLAPKLAGARHLDRLTRALPVDFFIGFSSAAALLGAPGQGSYAAANAYLDALAAQQRAAGRHGLSIGWGPWAESGMAAELNARNRQRMADQGLGTLAPDLGLAVLGHLLAGSPAHVGSLPVDWAVVARRGGPLAAWPFLSTVLSAPAAAEGDRDAGSLPALEALPPGERRVLLVQYLQAQVARVIGLGAADAIEPRQRLFDLGVDSLMAVELKNRLEAGLGRPLRTTLIFDFPTLEALANHLIGNVLGWAANSPPLAAAVEETAGDDGLDALDHDALSALLDERVSDIERLIHNLS